MMKTTPRAAARDRGAPRNTFRAGPLALTFLVSIASCLSDQRSPVSEPAGVVPIRRALEAPELRPFPQGGGFPGCPTCIKPNVTQATMNNERSAAGPPT
jgi:hypothetical protein